MARYTLVSKLLSDDVPYLKEIVDGTRFHLMCNDSYYYILTTGDTKDVGNIQKNIEAELSSMGIGIIDSDLYWGVKII